MERRDVAGEPSAQLVADPLQRVQIVELDLGGVVDVDDAGAFEQHDDPVVELVEGAGEPLPDSAATRPVLATKLSVNDELRWAMRGDP